MESFDMPNEPTEPIEPVKPTIGRPKQYETYFKDYYQQNKEKCNATRLANYHKKKNEVPADKLEAYLKCSSLYKLIKKNKDKLDLEYITFLLAI